MNTLSTPIRGKCVDVRVYSGPSYFDCKLAPSDRVDRVIFYSYCVPETKGREKLENHFLETPAENTFLKADIEDVLLRCTPDISLRINFDAVESPFP